MEKPRIEISKPRRFGLIGVLETHAMSFLLGIPLLIALAIVSTKDLGLLNLLIPIAALVGVVYILPFFGNAHISRIVRAVRPENLPPDKLWTVQVTLCPRIRKGLRALIEDADDVGYLALGDSALIFRGDSMQMTIPFDRIAAVHGENVGLRGLYVTAGRITLDVSGLDGFESLEIAERSSRVIFSSRKITRQMFAQLKKKLPARD